MFAKKKIELSTKLKPHSYINIELKFKSLFPFPPRQLLELTKDSNTNNKSKIYSKELMVFLALLNNLMVNEISTKNMNANIGSRNKKEGHMLVNYIKTTLIDVPNIKIKQVFLRKEYKQNITFIRAPYRGKNAQVHITKKYHNLLFRIQLPIKTDHRIQAKVIDFLPLISLFKDFSSNHIVQ